MELSIWLRTSFSGGDACSKAQPKHNGTDSVQQTDAERGASVCRKPNADERASIFGFCLNGWSLVRFRQDIEGSVHRR